MKKSIVYILLLISLGCNTHQTSDWNFQPFYKPDENPIVKADSTYTFVCPVKNELVQWQKADVFNHPVAFNPNQLEQVETSEEALAASLNKFGEVNTAYMLLLLEGKSREELVEELHGRIYYNPWVQNYEVADKFIAGNVVEKAENIGDHLKMHPNDIPAQESLKALQNAKPQPIPFDELDFNFGERWIPANIYGQYASHLFKTETNIHFSASVDEFSVKAQFTNANIYSLQIGTRKIGFNNLEIIC
jgi:N12 class adenine-specific DNA methylase